VYDQSDADVLRAQCSCVSDTPRDKLRAVVEHLGTARDSLI
jgi:hypothetical protein